MHLPLDRRTLLKASGVSLALPLLESMNPVLGAAAIEPPKRTVFICTTLGLYGPSLWPKTGGTNYETTEYLESVKDYRSDYTLFSGLQHEGQVGRAPHNNETTWLTSARGPGLGGFRNTISIDQYAAGKLGYVTRFPSISLGTNSTQSQSYTESGVMKPAESSAAKMFAKLFLQGKPKEVEKEKLRLDAGRSILDQLSSETKHVRRLASAEDNRQLDQYFGSLRVAEREIFEAQGWLDKPKPKVAAQQPTDVGNADYFGRTRLMFNLIPLIMQTDSSRVLSLMIQDHGAVPIIEGVTGQHHNLSHHGQDEAKIAQLRKVEAGLIQHFGKLLGQMKSKTESNGTLLDNTAILFGSNLGNANNHDPKYLPIFLAGGGYKHGQYVHREHGDTVPLCNMFVRLMSDAGIETESFGQSNGVFTW